MLNTPGNIDVEPRSTLLFVDFVRGDVVQLCGETRLEIDTESRRTVHFEVDSIVETTAALPARWSIVAVPQRHPDAK